LTCGGATPGGADPAAGIDRHHPPAFPLEWALKGVDPAIEAADGPQLADAQGTQIRTVSVLTEKRLLSPEDWAIHLATQLIRQRRSVIAG
jgi:hypothetical protein